jgi:hypothetical protein
MRKQEEDWGFFLVDMRSAFNQEGNHIVMLWTVRHLLWPSGALFCFNVYQHWSIIGWDAFLRGYWSHHWAEIHQQHLSAAAQTEHHQSGQLWASHCINEIWRQIRIAWKDHNDSIHGTNQKQEDQDLHMCTHLRIRHLHNQCRNVLVIHRDAYFIPDLDHKLATHPPINSGSTKLQSTTV